MVSRTARGCIRKKQMKINNYICSHCFEPTLVKKKTISKKPPIVMFHCRSCDWLITGDPKDITGGKEDFSSE